MSESGIENPSDFSLDLMNDDSPHVESISENKVNNPSNSHSLDSEGLSSEDISSQSDPDPDNDDSNLSVEPLVLFGYPTKYSTPPLRDLLKHRLLVTSKGMIASIPLIILGLAISFPLKAILRHEALTYPFPPNEHVDGHPELVVTHPANSTGYGLFFNVFANLGLFLAIAGAAVYPPQLSSIVSRDKQTVFFIFLYFATIQTFDYLSWANLLGDFDLIGWFMPVLFGYIVIRRIKTLILHHYPALQPISKHYNIFFLFSVVFLVVMLLMYNMFIFSTFFATSDPWDRFLYRMVAHPLLLEISCFLFRWLAIWLSSHTPPGFDFDSSRWSLFAFSPFFWFALAGRFLVSNMPTFGFQVLTAGILSLQDQVLRVSLLHRDRFFIKLIAGKRSESLFKRDHSQLYSLYYLYDEISETVAIVVSMFMTLFFNIVDHPTTPAPFWYEVVGMAILSIIFEVGADFARVIYYAKFVTISPQNEIEISQEKKKAGCTSFMSSIAFRSARFWKSIETSVHTASISLPKDFLYIVMWMMCWAGCNLYTELIVYHGHGLYNTKTDQIWIFLSVGNENGK